MDRFADAIIYIGIIFGGYCDWFVGVLAIHSAICVSYVRARAESQGVECNIGIAERAVRMIILMVGSLIGFFAGDIYFTYTIYILVILSYFTVGQRIVHVWRQLNDWVGKSRKDSKGYCKIREKLESGSRHYLKERKKRSMTEPLTTGTIQNIILKKKTWGLHSVALNTATAFWML